MAVATVVPEGQWYNDLVTTRVSSSMKTDILFRKLSQRLQKDDAVEDLKDRMNATLARVDAHRYDTDFGSLAGGSSKMLVRLGAHRFDIDIESSSSSHSGKIRVEHLSPKLGVDSEVDTSDSELPEEWDRVYQSPGDGGADIGTPELSQGSDWEVVSEPSAVLAFTAVGKKVTRKGFFRLKSRMRRAKKQLAAAGEVIAEAGHKIMKAHHKHAPASEGVWMVNNPVYEFEKDMFEFAMGAQLRKRDAWSHLRYNSLN